ncbi:hypothetical protein LVY74_16735 [Acinetobacter sp. ME22]|uniref:hypothetical protein n=1 Tax=Acinetobacter sp. ME22 TaxID=2904802 RepID=UPI001EDB2D74|nr:hypothetical protein [Acinetobacter sp. ME22]MCG2575184.1 hypothetical protein [Acinetobacter sp. ME22]
MRFSKVALLSALARLSALAHGFGCGAAMSVPRLHDCSPFAFSEPSSNQSKQNKLSQKKRRLMKRRLGHK